MKVGCKVIGLVLLTLIVTWGLSGCSKTESATITKTEIRNKEVGKGDEHAKFAEAEKASHQGEEHGHHHKDGHARGVHNDYKHGDHKHGEHHGNATETHAKHAESENAGHKEEHANHHLEHGHKRGEHKDPKHGDPKHGDPKHSDPKHSDPKHSAHPKHGAHRDHETATQGSVKVGDKTPDFSVRTLDGKSVKLSELQKDVSQTKYGVVVLSFWCTTCHSCRDVEDMLARLHEDYEGQAAVIGLSANADETAEIVAAFVKKNALKLPIVLDPSGNTADLFGVNKTTTTVVIDGNGVLRYCGQFRQKGGGSAEEALKAVLAGKEVAIKTTPHNG